jgi:hypothetical protein
VALFKHLMDFKKAALAKLRDKRKAKRHPVGVGFPLRVTITLPDTDTTGARRSTDPKTPVAGRDWSGVPLNLSESGLSVQLPPAAISKRDHKTLVTLALDGHQIQLPASVAHFRVQAASAICGLKLDLADATQRNAYLQLVEIVAMGSSFLTGKKPTDLKPRPGRTVEQYLSSRKGVLTAWRDSTTGKLDSFELVMNSHCVRGIVGRPSIEIFSSKKESDKMAWSAPGFGSSVGVENPEVRQLYRWVTFNLPKVVPTDLREVMRFFAASRGDWKAPAKKKLGLESGS